MGAADVLFIHETVHTVTDYWDGPRTGIADFRGVPHAYQSEFDDSPDVDDWRETFLLMPIDAETSRLATEDWGIWLRWQDAFHAGRTSRETHPALPEDRARHQVLEAALEPRLRIDKVRSIRATGHFRPREQSVGGAHRWDYVVKWDVVEDD